MRLNHTEMKYFIDKIKSFFIKDELWQAGKVQKIYSSGNMLCFNIRIPNQTIYLGIGRGGEYSGVFLLEKNVSSLFRIQKDNFLEYTRKHFKGRSIIGFSCDILDKCISIKFDQDSEIFLFWKGAGLYFTHFYLDKEKGERIEFSPWKSLLKDNAKEKSFPVFDTIGRRELEEREMKNVFSLLKEEEFLKVKEEKKNKNKIERKRKLIIQDLSRCELWREMQEKMKLDDFDLKGDVFKYKDISLKFSSNTNFYERKNTVFTKIKKLKRGQLILEERLKEVEKDFLKKSDDKKKNKISQIMIYPIWTKEQKRQGFIEKSNECVFFLWKNYKIALGLNSKSNDYLRSHWAKKDDLWFHLDGHRSTHLFVKNILVLDYSTIQVFSSMLGDYSNFKASQVPIIFTKVKDLKGIKNSPGKVIYKKEKHLVVEQVDWKEIISTSSPNDLGDLK